MKTSGPEVRCDGCGSTIPALHATAIFATLRGPVVRHKKLDLCDVVCLQLWAAAHRADPAVTTVPGAQPEPPAPWETQP